MGSSIHFRHTKGCSCESVNVLETENVSTWWGLEPPTFGFMQNAPTIWVIRTRHLLSHVFEYWLWWYRYFWSKVNIWNVARAITFIFDTGTDVLVKVSTFLRQKMSGPEGDSKPPTFECFYPTHYLAWDCSCRELNLIDVSERRLEFRPRFRDHWDPQNLQCKIHLPFSSNVFYSEANPKNISNQIPQIHQAHRCNQDKTARTREVSKPRDSGLDLFQSLCNLTGTSTGALPRCLSNFRATRSL